MDLEVYLEMDLEYASEPPAKRAASESVLLASPWMDLPAVVCLSFFIACLTEVFNVFMLSGPHAIQVYRRAGVRKSIENLWKIDL